MKPADFYSTIVYPTVTGILAKIAPAVADTPASRVLLMTCAGQESEWMARRQHGGPARSYWQFEHGGGVAQLLETPAVATVLARVCLTLDIPTNATDVFEAMAWNDTLACAMARLLLWQDPAPLPAVGDLAGSWQYYLRNWRPGAPRPDAWAGFYSQAKAAMWGMKVAA